MPSIPEIRTSVENKNVLVLDEHAKNGTFRRDARGRLIAYAGGFSVVFPYETADGEKWAFRCWHCDIANPKKRYQTISNAIKNAKLEFLCEFQYIDRGLNIDGNVYPTTRMRWVEGITLKDYICQNRNDKKVLELLADKFVKMTQALHAQSLAHGDLQHGNILVDKDHQLYLVDYDSFYCPELKGEEDSVTGLPDYQHPSRNQNKSISEKLDYFSELIIYLSILAIAENPSLVEKYKVEDADRLLFAKEDFADITHSDIYNDIKVLGDDFRELLDILEGYLKCNSIDELCPFDVLLLEKKITFKASVTKAIRNAQTVVIEWDVPFKGDVCLKKGIDKDAETCKPKGTLPTNLSESITYELIITRSDNIKIRKRISVEVFDPAEVSFKSDKEYVFPTIPFTISWNVKFAKRVELEGVEVDAVGEKVLKDGVDKQTTYILRVTDEFGTQEHPLTIKLLPIPLVTSMMVPMPDIEKQVSVSITQPKFNVNISFPQIEFHTIKTEIPKVQSFNEMGLNVELSPPLPSFTLKNLVKKVYNHIIRNK